MPILTVNNVLRVDGGIYRGSIDVYQRLNIGDPWQYLGTVTTSDASKTFTITSGYYAKATPNPTSPFIFYKWCYYNTGTACNIDCAGPGCSTYIPSIADKSLVTIVPVTSDLTFDAYFVYPCSNIEYYYRTTLLYYDVNRNGKIDKSELDTADVDFYAGRITRDQMYAVEDFYIQNCTLSTSVLTYIVIDPTSKTINAGGTQTFTITTLDQFSIPMPGVTVIWVNTNTSSGVLTPISTITNSSGQATASFHAADVQTNTQTVIYAYSGTFGGYPSYVTVVPVLTFTSIDLSPTSTTVNVGGTQQFTATCKDQFGNAMICPSATIWTSNNTSIATVNSSGLATGIAQGTTTINAAIGSINRSATITVNPASPIFTSIDLNPTSTTVNVGGTQQFTATCKDQFGNATICPSAITWTSNNTSIATVNSSGLATGIAQGTTTINAAIGSINRSATITVTQAPPVLTTITVSPSSATINVGSTTSFTATCRDQYGATMTCPIITWTSNNTSIATINISTGTVTGISAGSTTIRAASGPISGTASITVNPAISVLTSITVSPSSSTINIAGTQQFIAICKDQNNNVMTCPTIIWTSNNISIATVNSSGLVTGVAQGQTTIRAASGSISGIATVTISPTSPVLTSITPPTANISAGSTQQFTAIDQFGNAITTGVTWNSSNTLVATIDPSSGIAAGIGTGSTTITATYLGIIKTATINVVSTGTLHTIIVSPLNPTVAMGGAQQFFVSCLDQNNNSISCPIITWAVSDPAKGSISNTGLFTALASSGTVIVTATGGSIVGSSTVTLSPPVQAGFGTTEMIIVVGLAVGALYMMTRSKTLPGQSEKELPAK